MIALPALAGRGLLLLLAPGKKRPARENKNQGH
jgi:hypothetical protein